MTVEHRVLEEACTWVSAGSSGGIAPGSSATLSATWKAAENDCLERRNSIRPCVPSHAATCKAARNDCLAWRTDQTAHLIARSLRGKSGEATDRSKPSDNVPTLVR